MNLYSHQQKILQEDKKYAGLFLGTGSGKTLIALGLARGKTLVICPKTQREDRNWEREAQKSKLKIDLTVMSKEDFRKRASGLEHFDTVIVDEAHTCLGVTPNIRWVKKQPIPKTSQLFEELGIYIMRTKPQRVYLCTATIIRSPMTVWGAAKLLGQQWNFYEFREKYYVRLPMPGREVWTVKTDSKTKDMLAEVVKKLGYTGRLEDFFDVPPQTFRTIHVELSAAQKGRIKDMALIYPEPIVRVGKIHQIENGCLAGDEFNRAEFFDNEKLEKLKELALEFPRMVIFAKYRAQITHIEAELKHLGYKVLTLTGDTKERGEVILEVNQSKECIFIVQAQVSSGWQLGKTKDHPEYYDYNCMVFMSMDYSVINRIQGEGRILRADNLKKNLYIDIVVKGGVDEEVQKCILNKKDFDERIYCKKISK